MVGSPGEAPDNEHNNGGLRTCTVKTRIAQPSLSEDWAELSPWSACLNAAATGISPLATPCGLIVVVVDGDRLRGVRIGRVEVVVGHEWHLLSRVRWAGLGRRRYSTGSLLVGIGTGLGGSVDDDSGGVVLGTGGVGGDDESVGAGSGIVVFGEDRGDLVVGHGLVHAVGGQDN